MASWWVWRRYWSRVSWRIPMVPILLPLSALFVESPSEGCELVWRARLVPNQERSTAGCIEASQAAGQGVDVGVEGGGGFDEAGGVGFVRASPRRFAMYWGHPPSARHVPVTFATFLGTLQPMLRN